MSRIRAKDYYGQKRSDAEVETERKALEVFYSEKRKLTDYDFEDWKNGKVTQFDLLDEKLAAKQAANQANQNS